MNLKEWLNLEADKDTTKKEIGKNGETKMHLTVENENIDVSFSLDFIENNLSNSICHYTVLFNFWSVYLRVLETLLTVEISIGFSENLTLSLHKEIQAKTEVTIHSGTLNFEGNKVHHSYVSNDLSYDQSFVFVALN